MGINWHYDGLCFKLSDEDHLILNEVEIECVSV